MLMRAMRIVGGGNLEKTMCTRILALSYLLLMTLGLFGGTFQDVETKQSEVVVSVDRDPTELDLAAIRQASQSYVAAYNERNAEKLARLWSENAVYDIPGSNEQLNGRVAIQGMFRELFADGEPARLSVTIDTIRLISGNVASETGHAFVSQEGSTFASRYTAIYIKENGQWLLDSVYDTEVDLPDYEKSPLAELEWMVGEWIDQTEDSTVETEVRWTANGKFLTRNFSVLVPGSEELSGTQVIGWDPIQRQVRSWVFDSDGGFSNGSWKRKGDNWVVESTGYLADGRTASSIQVYARVDDDTFNWQSFGREVDGVRLPDIDSVRVLRK